MHLITEAMLDKAYKALNRKAAKGVDDEDWHSYGVNLSSKLQQLCHKLHSNRVSVLKSTSFI